MNSALPPPFCAINCGTRCKNAKRKYCSTRCQYLHDFNTRVQLFEAGLYPAALNSKWLKKYLIKRDGERCSKCGWAERHVSTGRVPIEIEHIDGDSDNNAPENIILLCPNCHALTPYFRGLNRGRGRAARLGGRHNPLRGDAPNGKRLNEPAAPFPLPRSLVALVEPRDATLIEDAGVP